MGSHKKNIDYYSLHGIWGAYASLVLGRIGHAAGVVVGDVRPPETGLYKDIVTGKQDRKSTRLNSSHITRSRMPSSA